MVSRGYGVEGGDGRWRWRTHKPVPFLALLPKPVLRSVRLIHCLSKLSEVEKRSIQYSKCARPSRRFHQSQWYYGKHGLRSSSPNNKQIIIRHHTRIMYLDQVKLMIVDVVALRVWFTASEGTDVELAGDGGVLDLGGGDFVSPIYEQSEPQGVSRG